MKNTKVNDHVSRKQLIRAGSPASYHCSCSADIRNHKLQFTLLVWIALVSSAMAQPLPHRPVDYVNPLIRTAPFEDAEYLGNNHPKGEELCFVAVVPGAMAGCYTVFLSDYRIKVELTATKNAGFHCYTFEWSEQAHVFIDLPTS